MSILVSFSKKAVMVVSIAIGLTGCISTEFNYSKLKFIGYGDYNSASLLDHITKDYIEPSVKEDYIGRTDVKVPAVSIKKQVECIRDRLESGASKRQLKILSFLYIENPTMKDVAMNYATEQDGPDSVDEAILLYNRANFECTMVANEIF